MDIIVKNISNKSDFRIECQKCKCKKVSLQVEYGRFHYESDDYYFVCNHCGHKGYLRTN